MMRTIEATASVSADRTLTLRVPADITPGEYNVVVVIDEAPPHERPPQLDLPVHSVGQWPEGLTLRRVDIYGDDGR
jgi:hypothetical protein